MPICLRVLHTEIHRFFLLRPERSQKRQAFVIRDLCRSSPQTSISLAGIAVDLSIFLIFLVSFRWRRGRSRADILAGRGWQTSHHLRRAYLIHVRYHETCLLEGKERRVQQLHMCESRMEQRRASPHGKPRDFRPEHFVRSSREVTRPQNRVLASPWWDLRRSQLHRHIWRPERTVFPLGQPVRMMMVVQMVMVTVGRGGRRGNDADDAASAGITYVFGVVVIVVVIRSVQWAESLFVRGFRVLDQAVLRLMRLLLQQTMYLEPIGASTVTWTRLRHAYHQTLPQATRLASGTILLVDHADAAVLAFRYAAQIVISTPEEGLCNRKRKMRTLMNGNRLTICTFAWLRTRCAGRNTSK